MHIATDVGNCVGFRGVLSHFKSRCVCVWKRLESGVQGREGGDQPEASRRSWSPAVRGLTAEERSAQLNVGTIRS